MSKILIRCARAAQKLLGRAAVFVLLGNVAQAHSFSVAIVADDAGNLAEVQSSINGFLVASAERDGHANETADGHLGGLDVFFTPLPASLAPDIAGLVNQPSGPFDIAVVLGDSADIAGISGIGATTVVMEPGALPNAAQRADFAIRYTARFALQPTDAAAKGYNAARRIDLAVRALGSASEPGALRALLAETSRAGVQW